MGSGPAKPVTGEIASRSLDTLTRALDILPNPDPVLRKSGRLAQAYTDLLADDQVGACIESLEMAVSKIKWRIDPNGCSDEALRFHLAAMENWDHDRIEGEAVMARFMGMQPFEIDWAQHGGVWVIRDLVGKPSDWFRYGNEGQLKLRMGAGQTGRFESVPDAKFIVARHRPSFTNPYGRAAAARCFWPVAFKKGGLKFWLKFTEKYGMPMLIGKQPRGAGDAATAKLLDMLESMIQDAVAVIPDDASVDILDAGGKGASADLFLKFVMYNDAAIAKAVLSQTLTTDNGAGGGSYALGQVHGDVRDDVAAGTFKLKKHVYDSALRLQHEFNFEGPAPVMVAEEDEEIRKDRAERDESLRKTGVRFKKSYFGSRYGLKDDEFDLEPEPPATFSAHVAGCQCRGCAVARFSQADVPAHQIPVDDALKSITGDPKIFAQLIDPVVRPVMAMIEDKSSYEEILAELAGLHPQMDVALLADKLERAIFATELWGRISAQSQDGGES